jgi:hypothetical protein
MFFYSVETTPIWGSRLRLSILLLSVIVLLAGCVAPELTPPRNTVDKVQRVYVVAMKPPPLIRWGDEVHIPDNGWLPTAVLAGELQAQLRARGIDAVVAPDVQPLYGAGVTAGEVAGVAAALALGGGSLRSDPLAPVRYWYNSSEVAPTYQALPLRGSAYVIEVGLSNYEIEPFSGGLLVQVHVRLIDTTSSRLVGRARASNPWNMPNMRPLDRAFADNGARFKAAFASVGETLTKECLQDLGLLP